jgi:hypothetical protein
VIDIGLAGGTSYIGTRIENYVVTGACSRMVTSGGVTVSGLAQRAGGRLAGGGIAGGLTEFGSIALLEDRSHSAEEVFVRTGRAAAIGAVSTWAGAEIGAAVGTAVMPGVGTVVGVIIGIGVGWALSELVPGGREDWEPAAPAREAPLARTAIGPAMRRVTGALEEDARARDNLYRFGMPYAGSVGDAAIPPGFGLRSDERDVTLAH